MRMCKMKNSNLCLLIASLLVLTFAACDDYLDVKPEDKFLESQVYSTVEGVYSALNGIYLNLSNQNIYGRDLTMGTVEFLAQLYRASEQHTHYTVRTYQYQDMDNKASFEKIWKSAYAEILNINVFIQNINISDVLSSEKKKLLKGEALGLRAMYHFDMLRLFGPVYSKKPGALSIPYYSRATTALQDLYPASAVIDSVLKDVELAESLLENDPVRTKGGAEEMNGDDEDFYKLRKYRMNYFALRALKARILLYKGDKSSALVCARSVINEASEWFTWVNVSDVNALSDPDRIFYDEVLFGFSNNKLYNIQREVFDEEITDGKIYAPLTERLEELFENNLKKDYRATKTWMYPLAGKKDYRTFFKYAETSNTTLLRRYYQPLIRISEMYLIAAECETSSSDAIDYLNILRFNRGINDLAASVDVPVAIKKEYMKEFYGEGQLFFYYKRVNEPMLPDGGSSKDITMTEEKYVVPLPDSEIKYRN